MCIYIYIYIHMGDGGGLRGAVGEGALRWQNRPCPFRCDVLFTAKVDDGFRVLDTPITDP